MEPKELRETVQGIPVMKQLDPSLRNITSDILVDVSTEAKLSQGQVLYEKGSEDNNTGVLIVDGALTVQTKNSEEIEITAPNLLGEMQQFDLYGRRTATVVAKSDVHLLEFAWHDFIKRVIDHPAISEEKQAQMKDIFTKVAGGRLRELSS